MFPLSFMFHIRTIFPLNCFDLKQFPNIAISSLSIMHNIQGLCSNSFWNYYDDASPVPKFSWFKF